MPAAASPGYAGRVAPRVHACRAVGRPPAVG